MYNVKAFVKKLITFGLTLIIAVGCIHFGMGTETVIAAESVPTIRMGDNSPMTRSEFIDWCSQNGIRYLNINGMIYPKGIFFNYEAGKSFTYGKLDNETLLDVVLRPGVVSENVSAPVQETVGADESDTQENDNKSPLVYDGITPILYSDDELAAIIERVPLQNPLDTISAITLPNRRLTEAELEVWIDEYHEMGGATAFEIGVVREVNRVRAEYGLHPLMLDPALMLSARLKTQEFTDLQYYNHESIVHGSVTESAKMFGFNGWGVAENMTRTGRSSEVVFINTPEGIVQGMLDSSKGHKEVLLHADITTVGFGSYFAPDATGPNGNMSHMFYYAAQFGFYDE